MEELLVALLHGGAAPVGVAQMLVDRRLERGSGLLALDEREGDAVHEQHLVGHDALAALGAGDVDAELRDDNAVVGVRLVPVLPVDVVNPLIPPAVPAGQALDGGAVDQQVGGLLVGFKEARGADAGKRGDGLADPALIEPRLTVVVLVDDPELCPEPGFEDDFAETGAAGLLGVGWCWRARGSAFEMRPAHASELVDQR